jgi:hypothetical protein
MKRKVLYIGMIMFSIVFIIYVTLKNIILHPDAADFLAHKTHLKRPLNIMVWLHVMHVHVIAACMAMISGAVNFSARIMRKNRLFHRINGYVYVISALLVNVTSGYMAPYATGGEINSVAFNFLNIVWFGVTIAALVQIRRKQVDKHRKWMVRSYAFCFTNPLIHMIAFVLYNWLGIAYELSYTIGVYGSIVSNIILAEVVIKYVYKMPADSLLFSKKVV